MEAIRLASQGRYVDLFHAAMRGFDMVFRVGIFSI